MSLKFEFPRLFPVIGSGESLLTEVLRRSLALYDLVTEHAAEGGEIVLVDNKGKQEKLRIL